MKLFTFAGVVLVGLGSLGTGLPAVEDQGLTAVGADTNRASGIEVTLLHSRKLGEQCTPNLKKCADDGVTLLLCNKNSQWEWFKHCPACCRYGTHGYPDCYTQCDPTRPPATDSTLDARNDMAPPISAPDISDADSGIGDSLTPLVCEPKKCGATGNVCYQGKCIDKTSRDVFYGLEIDQYHDSFNIASDPSSRCSNACKKRKCCKNQGRSNEYCKCPDNIFLDEADAEPNTASITNKQSISSSPEKKYTCDLGQRKCARDGKILQHCPSNGEWVDLRVCPTHCLEHRQGLAYCVTTTIPELNSRQVNSYGMCRPEETGKKQCGSRWWIIMCKDGQWINWEFCRKGTWCNQQHEPKCDEIKVVPRPINDQDFGPCQTAGRQTCRNKNMTIVVCDTSYKWKKVGDCLGGKDCCRTNEPAGTAFCSCSASPEPSELEDKILQ